MVFITAREGPAEPPWDIPYLLETHTFPDGTDCLRWVPKIPPTLRKSPGVNRLPLGQVAGGSWVFSRGKLIRVRGCYLMGADLMPAIARWESLHDRWAPKRPPDEQEHGWFSRAAPRAPDGLPLDVRAEIAPRRWPLPDAEHISDAIFNIRKSLMLDRHGRLVWARDKGFLANRRGARFPAGTPVVGTPLTGGRGRIITMFSLSYHEDDVLYVLTHGRFPCGSPLKSDPWDT